MVAIGVETTKTESLEIGLGEENNVLLTSGVDKTSSIGSKSGDCGLLTNSSVINGGVDVQTERVVLLLNLFFFHELLTTTLFYLNT